MTIAQQIANELSVQQQQVEATIQLLDEGATVPFIARYRKEVTGGLDDTQLRLLAERLLYLRELDERRAVILRTIDEQGELTAELRQAIMVAETKTRLEDLYRPYMKKRRTKAQIAKEQGLEPLALNLLEDPTQHPEQLAGQYISADTGVEDIAAALEGAKQILMERFSEEPDLVGRLRDLLWEDGVLSSKVVAGKEEEGAKFSDYFEFQQPIHKVPSHRALALLRGRKEGILTLDLSLEEADTDPRLPGRAERLIAAFVGIKDQGRAADSWLIGVVRWSWRVKIQTRLDTELKSRLKESAEEEAIKVFASNLNDLLLAAPAGQRATMGLDPGLRTGVKVAVVDGTGKLVDTATIYPHAPKRAWDASITTLSQLIKRHSVELVSIGNGTASRETDKLVADLQQQHSGLRFDRIVVSEAGASVYSASELAAKEFPELDVSLRGAVSIARRLQDPLAELVKIDPKAIGVGQYQHDVSQTHLARALDGVVESCVNGVGVDVNTASASLLSRVAGLSTTLAQNIVDYRDTHGVFRSRRQLLDVPRFGNKGFEQSAGFMRIRDGDNPLDSSAVHPEAYEVVERISSATGRGLGELIGDGRFLSTLAVNDYTCGQFGAPTVRDILTELEKPGRDPRPEFKTASFKEGVEKPSDLTVGMILEGVVSNVTNFGAFVDIGVHQDGLVHISALADKFVKDPRDVVMTGQVVKVKVVEIDLKRNRIALTMRLQDKAEQSARSQVESRKTSGRQRTQQRSQSSQNRSPGGAMAEALRRAQGR